jgi:adenylate kinase
MAIVVVAGLPGAGKSTVLAAVAEKRKDYAVRNGGDMMFSLAKERGYADHRDKVRAMPQERQKEIQSAMFDALAKEKGHVIFDTHSAIKTPEGYLAGIPHGRIPSLGIACFIYITAPPKQIVERRRLDKSRDRDEDSLEELREHDMKNVEYLLNCSAIAKAPVIIIQNLKGGLQKAQEQFLSFLP